MWFAYVALLCSDRLLVGYSGFCDAHSWLASLYNLLLCCALANNAQYVRLLWCIHVLFSVTFSLSSLHSDPSMLGPARPRLGLPFSASAMPCPALFRSHLACSTFLFRVFPASSSLPACIRIYASLYAYMHAYMHIGENICIYARIYAYMHICAHKCIYTACHG